MTTMIYKRTVTDDCEDGHFEMVEILHSDWDSINAQIADVLQAMIPACLDNDGYVQWDKYEVDKWNDMGYEWRIEQEYAEGAMMSELLNSEFVQDIKRMYDYPAQAQLTITEPSFKSFPPEPEELAIHEQAMKTYPSTHLLKEPSALELREFPDTDIDKIHETNQERAKKAVKMLFGMCDYLRNGARPKHMSWRSAVRHWKVHDYRGRTTITQHFVFTGLSDSAYFNTEMFNGHNITYKDYQRAKDDADYKAYLARMKTPEGKAEEEARRQAEADLRTYMGENGLTSYAHNGDGSISVWRD